jgi:hypothetical protein
MNQTSKSLLRIICLFVNSEYIVERNTSSGANLTGISHPEKYVVEE